MFRVGVWLWRDCWSRINPSGVETMRIVHFTYFPPKISECQHSRPTKHTHTHTYIYIYIYIHIHTHNTCCACTFLYYSRDSFSLVLCRFRMRCQKVITHKMFDHIVLFFIFLNCITIALERPDIQSDSTVYNITTLILALSSSSIIYAGKSSKVWDRGFLFIYLKIQQNQ